MVGGVVDGGGVVLGCMWWGSVVSERVLLPFGWLGGLCTGGGAVGGAGTVDGVALRRP